MNINMPEKVDIIINTLIENGYDAYAVGGCVRDAVLGRVPDDWDITTSAKPEEVKALFRRTIDTGITHGTVTVMMDRDGFEVTTYRIDGEYEDNRHPKQVEFTPELEEDLKRRDFTINAMAYNNKVGLIDVFGGIEDMNKKVIRCVGKPEERFDEDALRILRAVRFSAQLDFTIEENTKNAIVTRAKNLINISAERIRVELNKLLLSKHPEKLMTAYETGITKVVLPEFDVMLNTKQNNPHHIYNVGLHSIEAIKNLEQSNSILCWTMLLHDVAKPLTIKTEGGIDHFYTHPEKGAVIAKEILKRLKFDNFTIENVTHLIKYHDDEFSLTLTGMRRAMNRIGTEFMESLFIIKKADVLAQNPSLIDGKLEKLEKAIALYKEVLEKEQCVSLKDLILNGKDLIDNGFEQGKQMGEVLSYLLERVLEQPELNEKETLLNIAKNQYKSK